MAGVTAMENPKEPKTYKIPSRDWGVSASDAADMLIMAEEVKQNKPLLTAARKVLKAKQAAMKKLTK